MGMVKRAVKQLLFRIAPQWTAALVAARARAHSHRLFEEWGRTEITRKLVAHYGSIVLDGPFKGLTLTPATHAEHLGPFLLGTYESELFEAWATVFRGTYPQIIDVGAKFGYYAIGLAKRYPDARVVAFDIDWWAQRVLRDMSVANEVSNVEVRGFCSPEWLSRHVQDGAFVISDCEGFEAALFTAEVIEKLRHAVLIVETHDHVVPGITASLRKAFESSHAVTTVVATDELDPSPVPLDFLTERQQILAIQEPRFEQNWLFCLPKTGPLASLAAPCT